MNKINLENQFGEVSENAILGVSGITLVLTGAGVPVDADGSPQGSLYTNTTGSTTSNRVYVKGATTWIAVTTAS